jgi:hypothetical protein
MGFDVSSVKPQEAPPVSSGFDVSTVKPVGETGGGAALVTPTQRATPSSAETQEKVRSLSERAGEYWFGTPDRQELSGTEAAEVGGFTAAVSAAAPKALKYGGKIVGAIPTLPTRAAGKLMQAGGEALGKVPLARRAITGGVTGITGDVTTQAGEYLGIPNVVTLPVSLLTSAVGGYSADVLSRATGLEAKSLSKDVLGQGIQLTEEMLRRAGMSKEQAKSEIQRLGKIQQQLAEREGVATSRATARQVSPMEAERQKVLEDVAAARVRAQGEAKAAGDTAEEAARRVTAAEQGVKNANIAVDNLERRLVAMPNMSKEEFGKLLQSTTQKLFDLAQAARKEVANFKNIIKKAGDEPTVSTDAMYNSLEEQIKKTGNPTIRQVLRSIQNEISNIGVDRVTGEAIYAAKPISLAKADSLKGYIDNIINAKQFGETKLSKEILNQVRKTKTGLFDSIRATHPEYMEALSAFRTASRPLDIVERNGALAKIIEKDPLSTEYKMFEAEVVGKILNKSKAGSKAFERLIEVNPEVKESARLYFVKDLFGKEVAPTESVMRSWLQSNESVLRRTGLYDEFKNMTVARRTANQAVLEAKGGLEAAKEEAKVLEKTAAEAKTEAEKASKLQQRATKRLEETLKTKEPLEDVLRRSAARAKPAETKIQQQIGAATTEVAEQQAAERVIATLKDDLVRLQKSNPKEMLTKVQNLATDLSKKGVITPKQADELKRQIDLNRDKFKSAEQAMQTLKYIGYSLAIPALVGVGYKVTGPSDVITGR